MKKTIFILLLLACNFALQAQSPIKIQYNTKVFEGKWEAIDGDFSYELTFSKQLISYGGVDMEIILGSIKSIQKGVIIKETKIDGLNSLLTGTPIDDNMLKMSWLDIKNEMNGEIIFQLHANNKAIASWSLDIKPKRPLKKYPNWNKSTFDIPSRLEFKKKEIPLAERPLIVPEEEFTPIKAN